MLIFSKVIIYNALQTIQTLVEFTKSYSLYSVKSIFFFQLHFKIVNITSE